MLDKLTVSHDLLQHYERLHQSGKPPLCFVGFDGFTDEIIRVVDQRLDVKKFQPFYTISDFGKRILAAAGKSCNLELVPTETRLGGNAPLFTQSLLQSGHRVVFAGAIGTPGHVEPIFQPMAAACQKVYPLCPSGHTDALEFYDGKILLGKIGVLAEVSYKALTTQLPEVDLAKLMEEIDLFVSANWTMLPNMNEIWRLMLERIISACAPRSDKKSRRMFVDLADTAKRSSADLMQALSLLPKFQPAFKVTLGLNHSEAQQVYHALVGTPPAPSHEQVAIMAKGIRAKTDLDQVVIHATKFALAATETGIAQVEGPYCAEPKITTGAGDHFNAGYCNGLLCGMDIEACLLMGVGNSGFYVRNARSPTITEQAEFLEKWHRLGSNLDQTSKGT